MKAGSRKEGGRQAAAENRARTGKAPVPGPSPAAPVRLISAPFFLCLLLLTAAILLVYAPVRTFDFVPFDDPVYVSENPQVAGGLTWAGMRWAFTTGTAANWHPLTWLSHMLDAQLFGMNAGASHLVSVFLHILNTLLLFAFLYRITGAMGRSAFVAGLFALHPLHVQSVAWIAERKDVLSTLFWILTLWAYASFVRRPGILRYLAVVLMFVLGLMAKPMLVTLPFVLLLLDLWPLRRAPLASGKGSRSGPGAGKSGKSGAALLPAEAKAGWGRLVAEKIPLFVLAAASSLTTYLVQRQGGAVGALSTYPLGLRVENAVISYVEYVAKMFWPARLAVLYSFPPSIPAWWVAGAAAMLIGMSILAMRAGRRYPYLAVGWLWYLVTLLPVIGLIQVGLQGMADRYTYVPLIGIFLMVAWGITDLAASWPGRRFILPASAVLVLLGCAVAARAQVPHWKDGTALWSHELEVALGMDRVMAHNSLGSILRNQGRLDESIANYREAIRLNPDQADAHYGLGLTFAAAGRIDEAMVEFSAAVRLKPDLTEARINLGRALASRGRIDEAGIQLAAAVKLDPDSAELRRDLGRNLVKQGKMAEAVEAFSAAVRLRPDFAEALSDLGFALGIQGRMTEAVAYLNEAIRLKPDLAEAHSNLGSALARQGKNSEALAQFAEAVRISPDFALARRNLGILLAGANRTEEAILQFKEVLRINPQDEEIRRLLATLTRAGKQ